MKRGFRTYLLLGLLFCSGMIIPTCAQSYTSLWKEVENNEKKDLPKSALASVDKIISKANRQNDGNQLLKALMVRRQLSAQISPDSAAAMIPVLESYLEKEQRLEMQSLYHVAIGNIYCSEDEHLTEEAPAKAVEHYRQAMENPEILAAAKASAYIPIVSRKGADSKFFQDDLLNIVTKYCARSLLDEVGQETLKPGELAMQFYHKALQVYRKQGNRESEFFMMLDSIDAMNGHKGLFPKYGIADYRNGYKLLIQKFGDLEVCVEAYIRMAESFLRFDGSKDIYQWAMEGIQKYPRSKRTAKLENIIASLTEPHLTVYFPKTQSYPGEKDSLEIQTVNICEGVLKFYRTDFTAGDKWDYRSEKVKPHLKGVAFEIPVTLRKGEPYEKISQKMAFQAPEAGIYYIELKSGKQVCPSRSLYTVSSLHVMSLPVTGQGNRIAVSDAATGKPISGAEIRLCKRDAYNSPDKIFTTDERGECLIPKEQQDYNYIYVQYGNDKFCNGMNLQRVGEASSSTVSQEFFLPLFTDRSIYRPGQCVKVGGFFYTGKGEQFSVNPNETVALRLLDANGKEVAKQEVTTDEFGALGTEFQLPASCLNGSFCIVSKHGSVHFRVEQYKRPTFTVTFDDVKTAYAAGDTINLQGTVKTYSGFPIPDARVAVSVNRRFAYWRFYSGRTNGKTLLQDTVRTDGNGHFSVPVRLDIDADENVPSWVVRSFVFETEAVVTLENGETEVGKYNLFAGNRPAYITTTLPLRFCKEQARSFYVNQTNAGGNPVAGKARFELWSGTECKADGEWDFNTSIQPDVFSKIPSGEYILKVVPADRTDTLVLLKHSFTLFSLDDSKPVGSAPLQVYQTANEFPADGPVRVLVGSPLKDVYLHYDVFTKGKLLESRLVHLSDSVFALDYHYKEAYGDGLHILMAYVKEGSITHEQLSISKPIPDKQLTMHWKTFRDHLRPGQDETWTLQVLRKGEPVEASVMATLYDASLDKFGKLGWSFSLYFHRYIPSPSWRKPYNFGFNMQLVTRSTPKAVSAWDFRYLDIDSYPYAAHMTTDVVLRGQIGALPRKSKMRVRSLGQAEPVMATQNLALVTEDAASEEKSVMDVQATAAKKNSDDETDGGDSSSRLAAEVRTDFNETAYFQPRLVTDANGTVNMAFTLPQSITQWNFKALAHSRELDYGSLDTVAVASKDFMLQPNIPRFLRVGDRTSLAASLRNATDKTLSGTVLFEWVDPSTQKVIESQKKPFRISPKGEISVSFPVKINGERPLLVCRMTAVSEQFSDGEQHYIPILDDKQEVVESRPLSLDGKGKSTVDLSRIFGRYTEASNRRLTIEYTGNPAWLAIEALPTLSCPVSDDTYSMAAAYYSWSLAEMEAKTDPAIGQLAQAWKKTGSVDSVFLLLERNTDLKQILLNETPWVAAADRERERLSRLATLFDTVSLSYRRQSYLDKLVELQNADGSWSWFKGMPGSFWITVDVAHVLARLSCVYHTDIVSDKLQGCLKRAEQFMDDKISKEVAEMKKAQKKHHTKPSLSSSQLRYLNVCALRGYKPTADRGYLIDLLEKESPTYNMYDKSLGAVVLAQSGRQSAAKTLLQSLMEHTVSRPDMGRYFDAEPTLWNWESYHIPTQVAALETLHALTPNDSLTIQEMTRWLMQAKRTQTWGNPMSSVDAIYYLFLRQNMLKHAGGRNYPTMKLTWADHKTTDITADAHEVQMPATLGYFRRTLTEAEMKSQPVSLTIEKTAQPMAFGAVHAQYLMPVSKVAASASGLTLKCIYSVRAGQEWKPVTGTLKLRKGDLVRIRYEVTADRDYDFVCLKEGRPACMEPVQALSGYDWQNGCYRNVGDASTGYFFYQLPKGKHVLETEMRVDRAGTFTSAVPTVQCVYSPEFSGKAEAMTIHAE